MKNVTAVVISFMRPGYTEACLKSLRRQYQGINIIVADNEGENPEVRKICEENGAKYFPFEYDAGVCKARNFLVKQVETEYVLVGDDDFFYDENAKARQMALFLDSKKEFDLVGGRVNLYGEVKNYQGYIEKMSDHFKSTAIDPETQAYETDERSGLRYCPADLTFNYFMARTEKIKETPWDEQIKVAFEHFSWFYDFKLAGGKVAFSPDPVVVHKPPNVKSRQDPKYLPLRNRRCDAERFFSKYGIDYHLGMNGVKTFGPDFEKRFRGNDTKFTDFCITTFMRPKALERLLFSIAKYYPMANVYIADQNETLDREYYKELRERVQKAGLIKRFAVMYMGYDRGVSHSRNKLVRETPNKYKLILDDDFEFTPETDIGKMIKVMEADPNAGVVGGTVKQLGHDVNFEFVIEIKKGVATMRPDKNPWKKIGDIKYRKTGCVLNFALMKGDIFTKVQWDDNLKVTEHLDFYIKMKSAPYNIYYVPEVQINHPPTERDTAYKEKRQRPEFLVAMMRKHGLKKIKYMNGQAIEVLPDGSLKKYREAPEI